VASALVLAACGGNKDNGAGTDTAGMAAATTGGTAPARLGRPHHHPLPHGRRGRMGRRRLRGRRRRGRLRRLRRRRRLERRRLRGKLVTN